jgi:succinoglycan biosynthesis transport protein ExoP
MSNFDKPPLSLAQPASAALTLRQARMLQTEVMRPETEEAGEEGINIRDLFRMLLKHKWTLLACALLCMAVAVVYGLTDTPVYRATTILQIDRAASRIVKFGQDVDGAEGADMQALQTQYELLRSRTLAERVIDDLGLDQRRPTQLIPPPLGSDAGKPPSALENAESAKPAAASGTIASYLQVFTNLSDKVLRGYEKVNTPSVADGNVLGRQAVVGSVMGAVSIEPVANTRLVRINVVNTNPELAARIANAYVQSFIAMSLERRTGSSGYAKTFLEEQIKQTKAKLEESERQLSAYAKTNSIMMLDDKNNVVNQTFTDYAAALAKAEQERIKAEAIYTQISQNPNSAPQVFESKMMGTYKEQKAKLESEYQQNLLIYKPEFPKMVLLKAQIEETDARIKAEVGNVLTSFKGQYEAAKKQEEQIRARLSESRQSVLVTQDKSVDLNFLKRELDTNRQIYDSLLQRLKEVGVTSEVTPNNLSVVDTANTPLFPFKPQPSRNAAIGLGIGLMLGFAIIFLREHMDDSVKHADEIEAQFGLPLLGIIPVVRKKQLNTKALAMLVHDDPRSAFAEAYRSMRTALQFSTAEGAPRRLMVTSCVKSEGKSTTSLALAINFAQLGKKVLLIDADLRNPSVHKALEMQNEHGLSNFLSGDTAGATLIQDTVINNLQVMTAGPTPPNPVDLLMGPKLLMLLDKADELGFNQIIVDAPPILGIADSIVLGNQIQHILFVVRSGETRKSSIKDAMRRLRIAGLVPLGVALTRASSQNTLYYGYESYYGYGADEDGKNQKLGKPSAARPMDGERAAA